MSDLHETLITAITDQIQREYAAALFYRQVYHWFDLNLYPGSAAYFKKESQDELTHAYLLEDYLLKRNAQPALKSIPLTATQDLKWSRPVEVIEEAFKIETEYLKHIEGLVKLAREH